MFSKVLIANRGEIACRIATVLRANGIATVAVYSEADAEAPHAKLADQAVCIGPPPVAASYLDGAKIIAVALETGAEAIHPGYGLLSENAGFARAVIAAGIAWVGPTPEAIEGMGDKARAREVAVAAGVPVVPGSDGPVIDDNAAALADRLGYPVLVKAAAGGGGIGMQLVKKPTKLARALTSCRDRGRSSFGSDSIYIEKFIEQPRHIEVQVLFDQHGHGVHLFERECTLQRRHQKVIEEAPSPFISAHPELRAGLTQAALDAGHAVGYQGAGTVEFIVSPEGDYYFIEMNTRLQVEHTVTELITGVDLIMWQLRIAAGEPLTIQQADLAITGAAVECRVYAEDPSRRFAPCPGQLERFDAPTHEGVRVDAGYEAGQLVTHYYDPMLAKLIAFGPDRATALERARAGLAGFEITGITTNTAFVHGVLGTEEVRAGEFHTGWLEQYAKANPSDG
jgi:acetyl-CoA carboxylase biotin carboxylase subunit